MKKFGVLLLALLCVGGLWSCQQEQPGSSGEVLPLPASMEPTEVEDPLTYLFLKNEKPGEYDHTICVWENEHGQCQILYNVEVRKEGCFEAAVFHNITAALDPAKLDGLERTTVSEGDGSATFHAIYRSGEDRVLNFVGQPPEVFTATFEEARAFFAELMAALPASTLDVTAVGDVEDELLAALREALQEVHHLDRVCVYDATPGGAAASSLSLSDPADVLAGAVCTPEMSTTPVRFEIVALRKGADAKAVAEDFAARIDWGRWVCVCPDEAWIGTKDRMVLCVIGDDMTVKETAAGAQNAGWQEFRSLIRR